MPLTAKSVLALAGVSVLMGTACCLVSAYNLLGIQEHVVAERWSEIISSNTGITSQKVAYGIARQLADDFSRMHVWWHLAAGVLLVIAGGVLAWCSRVQSQKDSVP